MHDVARIFLGLTAVAGIVTLVCSLAIALDEEQYAGLLVAVSLLVVTGAAITFAVVK
jgi:hypothetical protein